MKKKVLSVLLVAAMAMSMLTGCGSKPAGNDAQSAASSEASKETEAAAETPASAEDETLTVWCWDPNFNVYAMKQAEKAYQVDHPNFKLDIQEKVYSDIETALITAAEAGDYRTFRRRLKHSAGYLPDAGLFLPQKCNQLSRNLHSTG